MNFSKLDFYIITVNLFAFILFIFITRLKPHPKSGHRDFVLQIVSLLGGAAGIFIAMLLFGFSSKYKSRFNKEDKKENMMIKVFVSCFLVIQIIAYLIQKGFLKDDFTFSFWNFFQQSKIFSFYLLTINLLTFTVFGIDKRNAVLNRPRIRITTLLGLSFFSRSFFADSSIHACLFRSLLLRLLSFDFSLCIFLAQAGQYFDMPERGTYSTPHTVQFLGFNAVHRFVGVICNSPTKPMNL